MKRVLVVIAVVLVAILLLQWRGWPTELPDGVPATPTAEVADMPAGPASADAAPMPRPPEDYVVVMERPLFLPERRPPEDEPEEEPVEDLSAEIADLAKLDVTATLILSPTDASVWVRDPDRPELLRLRLGDDYEGWTVAGIEHDRVRMERQGETETLDLLNFSSPGPARDRPGRQINRQPGTRKLPRPTFGGSPPPAAGG